LLDGRALGADVLRGAWLSCQRQLLLRLVDRGVGLLEVLVGRPAQELVELGLVALQPLARGGDLRGSVLDLGVLGAILDSAQAGLGDDQVLLAAGELAGGVVFLRLELRALGIDAAVLDRIEAGLGRGDAGLRLLDG
jgi:hypothetical protein